MPNKPKPEQPMPLDLARVKCLATTIQGAIKEWADDHDGTTGAEIGHAMLFVMYKAGQESALEAQFIMAISGANSDDHAQQKPQRAMVTKAGSA